MLNCFTFKDDFFLLKQMSKAANKVSDLASSNELFKFQAKLCFAWSCALKVIIDY